MQTISEFYSIKINIDYTYSPTHFIIASYKHNKAYINFNGELLQGMMPDTAMMLIRTWLSLHISELYAIWGQLERNHYGLDNNINVNLIPGLE
jgi:Domain of unknown function (DUF4160)